MPPTLTISYEQCSKLFEQNRGVLLWCAENDIPMPLWSTVKGTIGTFDDCPMIANFPTEEAAVAFKLRWL